MTALHHGRARLTPTLPPLDDASVRFCCAYVLRHQPRLFDGWPSARLYHDDVDAARVARIVAASPVLAARAVPAAVVFYACSALAADRRAARYGAYAAQVRRVMGDDMADGRGRPGYFIEDDPVSGGRFGDL